MWYHTLQLTATVSNKPIASIVSDQSCTINMGSVASSNCLSKSMGLLRHYIPDDHKLHSHYQENLKSNQNHYSVYINCCIPQLKQLRPTKNQRHEIQALSHRPVLLYRERNSWLCFTLLDSRVTLHFWWILKSSGVRCYGNC